MDSFCKLPFFFVLFFTAMTIIPPVASSQPQPCKSYKFPHTSNFLACTDLPLLDSSIHWNYHPSSNTIDIAYKKNNANHSDWIAWAINPTPKAMLGSEAFVAFQKSDGTMKAYTSPITTYSTKLEEGNLSFEVHAVSASFKDGDMIIYANFQLPGNSTLVNHVWQQGSVSDDTPLSHALSGPNVKSFGQIDFLTGKVFDDDDDGNLDNSKIVIRKVHGILNGIGWGILMPIGVMIARYLKAFEATGSAWFQIHRACQIVAYFTGTAVFGLGIYMGIIDQSSVHAYIGIAIFMSSTAQVVVALNYRPEEGEKDRIFWNIFHYLIGYGVISLAIYNMFRGFSISSSYKTWKNAYFGVIVSLGCVAFILEVGTWFLVCKIGRRRRTTTTTSSTKRILSSESTNLIM